MIVTVADIQAFRDAITTNPKYEDHIKKREMSKRVLLLLIKPDVRKSLKMSRLLAQEVGGTLGPKLPLRGIISRQNEGQTLDDRSMTRVYTYKTSKDYNLSIYSPCK